MNGPVPGYEWSLPFLLFVLTIAVAQILSEAIHKKYKLPNYWEDNRIKLIAALIFSAPVFWWATVQQQWPAIGHALMDYVTFMSVMVPMMIAAYGLVITGDYRPTPAVNAGWLLLGSCVGTITGTPGASLIFTLLLLRINKPRTRTLHTWLFVIFSIGNLAGLVFPVGTPLIMGLQKGISFGWFPKHLLMPWLIVQAVLITMYYVIDSVQYGKEPWGGALFDEFGAPRETERTEKAGLLGGLNAAVLLTMSATMAFEVPTPYREVVLWSLALVSWRVPGAKQARARNQFTWRPAGELATVFLGIFLTMSPALLTLAARGNELGVRTPLEFFFATGVLSAFLDNAPTLACFLVVGCSVTGTGDPGALANTQPMLVQAMCMGAVLFGALTYIGNGSNMLVKAIVESQGKRMPNFFLFMVIATVVMGVGAFLPATLYLLS